MERFMLLSILIVITIGCSDNHNNVFKYGSDSQKYDNLFIDYPTKNKLYPSYPPRVPRLEDYEDSVPLDVYKRENEWVPLDYLGDNPLIIPFNQLRVENMFYEEAKCIHGTSAYEYIDTIIRGMNMATGKPDFDLYPLLCDRDTVIVIRCWWAKSYTEISTLYIVFERQNQTTRAIYGYISHSGRNVD